MRAASTRVIKGSEGRRGGRRITPDSAGSKASARASVTAVTVFTHRIWPAVTGNANPANNASRITPASPPLVGSMNSSDFLMLSNTTRPSRTARAMVAKLSSVSTRSAASRAASVPFCPMATPILAALSAGASLTPSPVMATSSPWACRAATRRSLCSGLARANTSFSRTTRCSAASSSAATASPVTARSAFSPSCRPMAAAVTAWSPVIILTRTPARWQSATATMASSRGGSIRPTSPSRVKRRLMSVMASAVVPAGISQDASASTRWPAPAASSMRASQAARSSSWPPASCPHKSSTRSGAPLSSTKARPA